MQLSDKRAETKDVIGRSEAIIRAFGWKGGTVHQICDVIGCDVHEFLYKDSCEYNISNKIGWFAYRTNSQEFNQAKLLGQMKGNLEFWLGVISGVNTSIKLGEDTPRKF